MLYKEIYKRFPNNFNKYIEPFFGGGAVLFNLLPKDAIINDINSELINVYTVIKNQPNELIKILSKYKNDKNIFYEIRSIDRNKNLYDNLSIIEKAARIIYLNKTCYNGLYRVNSQGELNAPFGNYKNPKICDRNLILNISNYFNKNNIEIFNCDFEKLIKKINKNDFLYIDPPYDSISNTSNFTGYTSGGFNKKEQIRLKLFCDKLTKKGGIFFIVKFKYWFHKWII